jgi:hypothetical protein
MGPDGAAGYWGEGCLGKSVPAIGPSHSNGNASINTGSVISGACRPSRISSTISGASKVNRGTRLT